MVPQTLFNDNLNISSAFRGPDPTVLTFELTPTYFSDEIHAQNREGYRVLHKKYERGSTINERTLMNMYTYDGRYSEDFSKWSLQIYILIQVDYVLFTNLGIKFETRISSNFYNVRVIRLKSVIDVATQILGLLAGLAFLCRFGKFVLLFLYYFQLKIILTCFSNKFFKG